MRFKIKSLRKKFSLWLVLLIFFMFAVFSLFLIQNTINVTRDRITQEAESFAELSTKPLTETFDIYYDSGFYQFKAITQRILDLGPVIKKFQIVRTNGEIFFDSVELATDKHVEARVDPSYIQAIESPEKTDFKNPNNKNELQTIVFPYITEDTGHPYSIIYYVSYEQVQHNASKVINIILFLTVVFTIIGIVVMYGATSRLIVSPIEIVQKGADKISHGEYDYKIKINTNDEIEQLAISTNNMAAALESDIKKLKQLDVLKDEFISLAAHNLRTPVVHIRYNMDYLIPALKGKLDEHQQKFLLDVKESNEHLANLVEDLLNLTTLEKGSMKLTKFSPVDLIKIINKATSNLTTKIKEKNLNLSFDSGQLSQAEILGDEPKLLEVLNNCLDNAVQFNKLNGSIWVKVELKGENYVISIKDTGIGIKKEEIPQLFKKFHRATSYLTYDYSGQGLGLYITKMIVDAHNGKIWVESTEGQGSTFFISFPQKTTTSPLPKTKYTI